MSATAESSGRRMVRTSILALFVVFLHFMGQIGSLARVRNRYFRLWKASDAIPIVVDMLLLTFIVWGLNTLIDRHGGAWAKRLRNSLFVLAIGSGGMSYLVAWRINFPRNHPSLNVIAWLIVFGVVVLSFVKPKLNLSRLAARICYLFSPLIVIVVVPMFFWKSWTSPLEPLMPAKAGVEKANPVYFFVFDEWSYLRSTQNGEFAPQYPNLRRLAGESISFRDAHSPATYTAKSLPILVFQNNDFDKLPFAYVKHNNKESINGPRNGGDIESILGLAGKHDYNSAVIGFYLPYRRILGDQVDRCREYAGYIVSDRFSERLWLAAIENLRYIADPLGSRLFRIIEARLDSPYRFAMVSHMKSDLWQLIDAFPNNTLAFMHFPLPHAPFVFNEDGSYRGPYSVDFKRAKDDDEDRMLAPTPEYDRNLRYLDTLIGQIVQHLKNAGRYDNALLILTSDHSWRADQDPQYLSTLDEVTHVPLLIKLPHQKSSYSVDTPTKNYGLRDLIGMALKGNIDEKSALALLTENKH